MRRVRFSQSEGQAMLAKMPPSAKQELRAALDLMRKDKEGQFKGLDVKQLETDGGSSVYRLRVGVWRVAFMIEDQDILIARVFHRKEGYSWLADL